MHNLTTLLSGQYDQCILCHRLEIFEYMYCSIISLYRGLFTRISDTIQKWPWQSTLWNHAKLEIIFLKKMEKGGLVLVVTYLDMYQIIKEFIRNVVQKPGMLPMPWSIYIKAFLSKIFSMRDHGQELVNILLWVLFNHNFWYISSYTLCWRCLYSLTSACISILTTDNWILRILTTRKTFSTFFF